MMAYVCDFIMFNHHCHSVASVFMFIKKPPSVAAIIVKQHAQARIFQKTINTIIIYIKIRQQIVVGVRIMSEIRNFVLRDKKGKETGVFTGNQPRQAALKAANRGKGTKAKPTEIRLRERGSKKIHVYKAWKEMVAAPKNKPSWMPDKINKPNVKKVGVEQLDKI